MQIDGETAAWIGVLSSVATAIGGYFVTREKVSRLEQDVKDLRDEHGKFMNTVQEKFVTMTHLEAVMLSMKDILKKVQDDVRLILDRMVQEHGNSNRRN